MTALPFVWQKPETTERMEEKNYKNITTFVKLAFLLLIHAFTESRIETSAWTKKTSILSLFPDHSNTALFTICLSILCVCDEQAFQKWFHYRIQVWFLWTKILYRFKRIHRKCMRKKNARDHCFRAIFLRSQCICSWSLCTHLSANLTANRQEKKMSNIREILT